MVVAWSAPFSLPGVPILGYALNVTTLPAGKQLNHSLIVLGNDLSVFLSISIDLGCPGTCSQFGLSVAAINNVGEGELTNISFFLAQGDTLQSTKYSLYIIYVQ